MFTISHCAGMKRCAPVLKSFMNIDDNSNSDSTSQQQFSRIRAASSTTTRVADLSARLDDTLLFFCPQFQSVVIGERADGQDPVAIRDVFMVSNRTLFETCDVLALQMQNRPTTVQSLALSTHRNELRPNSMLESPVYEQSSGSASINDKRLVFQCRPGDELKKPITLRRFSPLPKSIDFECGQFYYFIGVPDSQIVLEILRQYLQQAPKHIRRRHNGQQRQRQDTHSNREERYLLTEDSGAEALISSNSGEFDRRKSDTVDFSRLCDDLKVLRLRLWISCTGEGPSAQHQSISSSTTRPSINKPAYSSRRTNSSFSSPHNKEQLAERLWPPSMDDYSSTTANWASDGGLLLFQQRDAAHKTLCTGIVSAWCLILVAFFVVTF